MQLHVLNKDVKSTEARVDQQEGFGEHRENDDATLLVLRSI